MIRERMSARGCIEFSALGIIIGLLSLIVYHVTRPPIVTKETIDRLQQSVSVIEAYTTKLTVITELSKQQVKENDNLYGKDKPILSANYDDLARKYGIDEDESIQYNIKQSAGLNASRVRAKDNTE